MKHDINKNVIPCEELSKVVNSMYLSFDDMLNVPLCISSCALDSRFCSIRTQETNIGNFIADIMRRETVSDFGFINSGKIRADKIYPPGIMCIGDWYDLLPYRVGVIKIEITGKDLKNVLENSVSLYPAYEGRFLQISGFEYTFDPNLPSGSRIIDITVKGKRIEPEHIYTAAVSDYIAEGNDGYNILKSARQLIDSDNCQAIKELIFNFFNLINNPTLADEIEHRERLRLILGGKENMRNSIKKKLSRAMSKITALTALTGVLGRIRAKERFRLSKRSANIIDLELINRLEKGEENRISIVCLKRLKNYDMVKGIQEFEGKRLFVFAESLQNDDNSRRIRLALTK